MQQYSGLIILSHQTFEQVSEAEILQALPAAWKQLDRQIIEVKPILNQLGDEESIDWKAAAREQSKIWKAQIKPVLLQYPTYGLCYFGLAHIPLALHLGYLIGSAKRCEIFHQDRENNTWHYRSAIKDIPTFRTQKTITETANENGGIVFRFSTYYQIFEDELLDFPHDIITSIYTQSENSTLETFNTIAGVQRASMEFREQLDDIKNSYPKASKIHLFAAVPVEVAFAMGKQISKTVYHDKPIQLYSYQGKGHEACFTLQAIEKRKLVFSDDELKSIDQFRQSFSNCLENQIKPFIQNRPSNQSSWYELIAPELKQSALAESNWRNFPHLHQTSLINDSIDSTNKTSSRFYKDGKWSISNFFLGAILRQFKHQKPPVMSALRMFLFHEALHYGYQGLTRSNAQGIGRFPSVLAKADYEADIWAMFQEYAFAKHYQLLHSTSIQQFFVALHQQATDTMWAFDVAESDPDEMQLRRIIRYLSLYINLAKIQHGNISSLVDIANGLAVAPTIDLKGLKLRTDFEGRIIASLTYFDAQKLAIGIYHQNQVHILNASTEFPIKKLIVALHERDAATVASFAGKIWEKVGE